MTDIKQARLVAVAIYLRSDLARHEKAELLRAWENVTFRIYGMLDNDARTAVGDYVRLGWSIVREKLSAEKIRAKLVEIGKDYPIKKAIEELRKADCYTDWQPQLRYFFYRYEEHLAGAAGQNFNNEQWNRIWLSSAADSIEHIQPQSSGDEWVHWLGNLLVLPPKLNSKLGPKAPRAKADDYTKTGLLVAQDVVARLPGWGRAAIKKRENELLDWALKEWA